MEKGKIIIKLEEQASPNRTSAIDAICEELNRRQATYPGTDLRIEFDTTRAGGASRESAQKTAN